MWTVAKLAAALGTGRVHLAKVLNNEPGRGKETRPRVVALLRREFPQRWPAMVAALGWEWDGTSAERMAPNLAARNVPDGTFHVEH